MPMIETEVLIARSSTEVFAFATNAARWPQWHPATAGVDDVPDRPLVEGETVLEHIRAAGRTFDARWRVVVCEPGVRWDIETATPMGEARIAYRLQADGAGCRFRRTLCYRSTRAPWRWLDRTLTRWILVRQSRRALENLRRVLEAGSEP